MRTRRIRRKRRTRKGGTIGSRDFKLVAKNRTGRADLRVLQFLGVEYRGADTDRINLLHFYEFPNHKTPGFNKTFLEALEGLPKEDLKGLRVLLGYSYDERSQDAHYAGMKGDEAHRGHVYMASIVRWLMDRVEEYETESKVDIESGKESLVGYRSEFEHEYDRTHPPPTPPVHTVK